MRGSKKMTRIEKAVKIVSDLYDFYRRIPKIPRHGLTIEEKQDQARQGETPDRTLDSAGSPFPPRR